MQLAWWRCFGGRLEPAQSGATKVPTGFTDKLVAKVNNPTSMAIAPDARIFVAQKGGKIRVIKNGQLLSKPFITLTTDASFFRGLLGITFDPNFSTNHYVYVFYTATSPALHNRVSRFTANGDVAVAGSEKVLLDLPAFPIPIKGPTTEGRCALAQTASSTSASATATTTPAMPNCTATRSRSTT